VKADVVEVKADVKAGQVEMKAEMADMKALLKKLVAQSLQNAAEVARMLMRVFKFEPLEIVW
jgi:hypothetical protein